MAHTYIIIIKLPAIVKGFLSYIYVMCAFFKKIIIYLDIFVILWYNKLLRMLIC